MRKVLIDREKRIRPVLQTPAKGSVGDMTDESQAAQTDVGSILQRYGGNLAEIAGWRGVEYGVQPETNLEDAIDKLKEAEDLTKDLGYGSLDEAMSAIANGTFGKEKKENENEKKESVSPSVEEGVSQDGKSSAS